MVIIGEAPGPEEDLAGVPFIGKTGSLLREYLIKVGLSKDELYFTNTVACVPRDYPWQSFRNPKQEEIDACKDRFEYIRTIIKRSKLTLCVGKPAFETLMDQKIPKVKPYLGWHNREKDTKVYFTYHPSYICRRAGDPRSTRKYTNEGKDLVQTWVDDLKAVNTYIKKGVIIDVRK